MLYIEDLHLCRAGLQAERVGLQNLLILLGLPGGSHEPLRRRTEEKLSFQDLLPKRWPAVGLDRDLIALSLAVEEQRIDEAEAIESLLTPENESSGDYLIQSSVLKASDWERFADQAGVVAKQFGEVLSGRTAEDFLLTCRENIKAGRIGPAIALELVRASLSARGSQWVRRWLLEYQDIAAKESLARWLDHYFPAIGSAEIWDEEKTETVYRFSTTKKPKPQRVTPTKKVIGNYKLVSQLGRGGMGVVYEAFDPRLDRTVALKLLDRYPLDDTDGIERFLREAKAAARMTHPNIVAVHDIGRDSGFYYYTMEQVRGPSLSRMIANEDLSLLEAAEIGSKIAEALHYAHRQGIIHRDVKPSNIMLDGEGTPFLSDFGLALDVSNEQTRMTMTGAALGTPPYMPPEQVENSKGEIDARSDVYSLGATLYEAVTGQVPFQGKEVIQIVRQVLTVDPPRPSKLNPAVPPDFETIILKAMEKEPEARYQSAQAMAHDLANYLEGDPISARRPNLPARVVRYFRRRRTLSLSLIAVVLALFCGPAYFWASDYYAYRDAYQAAQEAFLGGEFLQAIEDSEEALRIFPEEPELRLLILRSTDAYKAQVEDRLTKEKEELRGHRELSNLRAEELHELKRLANEAIDALRALDDVTSQTAQDLVTRVDTALLYLKEKKFLDSLYEGIVHLGATPPRREEATQAFDRAIELEPNILSPRLYQATNYLVQAKNLEPDGKLDQAPDSPSRKLRAKAAEVLAPAAEGDTSNWALLLLRGSILVQAAERRSGFLELSRALDLLWQNLTVQENLGVKTWRGSFKIDDPSRILTLYFQPPAVEMFSVKRFGKSENDWLKVVKDVVERERIQQELARMSAEVVKSLQFAVGDDVGATETLRMGQDDFARIVKLVGADVMNVFFFQGVRYLTLLGETNEARKVNMMMNLLTPAAIDPSLQTRALAELEFEEGKLDKAIKRYETAIEQRPEDEWLRTSYFWFVVRLADSRRIRSEAEADYRKLFQLANQSLAENPASESDQFFVALANYHLGRFQEAASILEDLGQRQIKRGSQQADVHIYRAAALTQLGRHSESEAAWRLAQKYDPSSKAIEAWLVRRRVLVSYGEEFHEVECSVDANSQLAYALQAEQPKEQAARLMPLFYYYHSEDISLTILSALRLAEISRRLQLEDMIYFTRMIFKGVRPADPNLQDLCKQFLELTFTWNDKVPQILSESGHSPALAYYLFGLVRDLEGQKAEAVSYYEQVARTRSNYPYIHQWAREGISRLGQ